MGETGTTSGIIFIQHRCENSDWPSKLRGTFNSLDVISVKQAFQGLTPKTEGDLVYNSNAATIAMYFFWCTSIEFPLQAFESIKCACNKFSTYCDAIVFNR